MNGIRDDAGRYYVSAVERLSSHKRNDEQSRDNFSPELPVPEGLPSARGRFLELGLPK